MDLKSSVRTWTEFMSLRIRFGGVNAHSSSMKGMN
jgi:hypothetical protein